MTYLSNVREENVRERFGWSLVLLARLYRREVDRGLYALGISQASAAPLRYLARFGKPLRLGALAEALSLEGPTVVGVVDQLERQGLVRKVSDAADRRVSLIELSEAGVALNARIQGELTTVRVLLFRGIEPDDLKTCEKVFEILGANLRDLRVGGREDAPETPLMKRSK